MKAAEEWTYSESLLVIRKLKEYFSSTKEEDWVVGPTAIEDRGVITIIGSQLSEEADQFFALGFVKGIKPENFSWMDELKKYSSDELENIGNLPNRAIQAKMYSWGISERFCDGAHSGIICGCNKIGMLNRLEKIMENENKKEKMRDQQLKLQTGMSGEFLVAGKLFKMGLQVSITLGNAKSVDLFASDEVNSNVYEVQVKTLRKVNCFLIQRDRIHESMIYVFVLLNNFSIERGKYVDPGERYFIVTGKEIIKNEKTLFGSSIEKNTSFQAINFGPLKEYENNWNVFKNGLTNGEADSAVVS